MSSNPTSDISSFAAWEAQNPAQSFSGREQSLLDMKDTARVWGDRDSSNDARSSNEESASENEALGGGSGGVALGGGKKVRMLEIPSSTQGTESQLLSQVLKDEVRPERSTFENGESDEKQEDPLADKSLLSTIINSPGTAHDVLQLQTSVQDFAIEHLFWAQRTLDEEEVSEFESDVFEFAKAAGLSANLAKVEVMRAMGAWKASKGIPLAQTSHIEEIFEKVLETFEVVTEAIGSEQKKRKRGEKVKAVTAPASVEAVGGSKEVGEKEPKAKRQRPREKKRKLEDVPAAETTSLVSVVAKAVEVPQGKEADTESQKKRKLDKKGAVTSPVEAMTEKPAKQNNEKKKTDQATTASAVEAPKSDKESVKRIKNEKKKEKKKRAKLGPTTSSYFTKTEVTSAEKAPAEETKMVLAQAQSEDAIMEDVHEDKVTSVDRKSLGDEEVDQSNAADNEEKKKRKKKRNKNRLSGVENAVSLKAAEERAARKLGRSEKPKDITLQVTKHDIADVPGVPSEISGKKKRVRSKIMKGAEAESKEVDKAAASKLDADALPISKNISKDTAQTVSKPSSDNNKTNEKSSDETFLVRPLKTFDANGVFGTADPSPSDTPKLAIESAAIEPTTTETALAKEKSRKRKKKSETGVEVESDPVVVVASAPEDSEPPKKKSRDRKRKYINKLLDVQITGVEEPATPAEPLVELPDTNSEKKMSKRHKSKKRSIVGTEIGAQASKEASNSSHS